MRKQHLHQRRRPSYRKFMASLTGAALFSSAMFGLPTAKAAEPVKSEKTDALTEALLRSKNEIQGKIQDKIVEQAAQSLEALKNNPAVMNEAFRRSRDFLEEKIKESVQAKVAEKRTEWEQELEAWLKPKQEQAYPVMDITATAYTSGHEDNGIWNDKTHIGTKVRPGIIAVDPKVIPLGSKVYIEFAGGGGMHAVAEDTGGAIKGSRIDIAMETRDEAKKFGIQPVKVHVLEKGTIV